MSATAEQKRNFVQRKREAVLVLLGSKCNWPACTWTDPRALQIDHVNGGGTKEARKLGNVGILNKILKMATPETEYQLLCANHNWVKRCERHETKDQRPPLLEELVKQRPLTRQDQLLKEYLELPIL